MKLFLQKGMHKSLFSLLNKLSTYKPFLISEMKYYILLFGTLYLIKVGDEDIIEYNNDDNLSIVGQ